MRRAGWARRTPVAVVSAALTLALLLGACSTARDAARRHPTTPTTPPVPVPTAIAPPQAPSLDGTAGIPAPSICSGLDRAAISRSLGGSVTARPASWNDGGVPSLDLCALTLTRAGSLPRTVLIGVSALTAQPTSLPRLTLTLGPGPAPAPEIGPDAQIAQLGTVFSVDDRVVRITSDPELTRPEAVALAHAVRPVVPAALRPARLSDAACQPSGSTAELFLRVSAQLRRDYRVRGGLTCIWGTTDATVAIVESLRADGTTIDLPEANRDPRPRRAPVGEEGYFLPEEGELVFRKGKRVVRVTALSDPARPVTLDRLIDIVEPIMPLFLR